MRTHTEKAQNMAAPAGYAGQWRRREGGGNLPRRETRGAFGAGFTDELDAVRWRPQRDVVRDILLSAAECGAWLTLGELRAMTRFPEASIAAQVRALRTAAGGGFVVGKRQRLRPRAIRTESAECQCVREVWEYRIEGRFEDCRGDRIERCREDRRGDRRAGRGGIPRRRGATLRLRGDRWTSKQTSAEVGDAETCS
jgi:hypothetical protein